MAKLEWDQVGSRRYETGLDRGVLYVPGGEAFPWSGLTGIDETFEETSTPHHIDGVKYMDREIPGDFAARLEAFTYPDEFEVFNGVGEFAPGLFVAEQKPRFFHISYRTGVGNDVDGTDYGYKLHILYNVVAIPDDVSYETIGEGAEPASFTWTLICTPNAAADFRPTAHVVIDSTEISADVLAGLEEVLYGTSGRDATLPSLQEMMDLAIELQESSARIEIVDNGDGTWTANGPDRYITMLDSTTFQITDVDADYLDADTYEISTTIL